MDRRVRAGPPSSVGRLLYLFSPFYFVSLVPTSPVLLSGPVVFPSNKRRWCIRFSAGPGGSSSGPSVRAESESVPDILARAWVKRGSNGACDMQVKLQKEPV